MPTDKTFHLATRAQGSQHSGGFPPRPCGQVFHLFLSSSIYNSVFFYLFPYLFFPLSISLHPKSGVFETRVKATKKYVFICTHQGLFSSFIYFHSPSSACCGQKTKSDSFILLRLGNYNLVITRTQLGLQHSFNNQVNSFISLCPDKTSSLQNSSRLGRNTKNKKKKETMQYWVG